MSLILFIILLLIYPPFAFLWLLIRLFMFLGKKK